MNLIDIARPVPDPTGEGRMGFEVDAGTLYPRAVDDLKECVEYCQAPVEGSPLLTYYRQARLLNDSAWEVAMGPKPEGDGFERQTRATVLELARLWFTELLHESIGHVPMYLRIVKDTQHDWSL